MAWKNILAAHYTYATGRPIKQTLTFYDESNVARMAISQDGTITIFQGYAWDGCSPSFKVFDWGYLGTPDGTTSKETGRDKTYFASLVHDALYQFMDEPHMPFSRYEMDKIFLEMLKHSRFGLRYVYYYAVRAFGGIYRWFTSIQ